MTSAAFSISERKYSSRRRNASSACLCALTSSQLPASSLAPVYGSRKTTP